MRKEYGAALRAAFAEAIGAAHPEFVHARKTNALAAYPGERAYAWRVSETLNCWVVLVPDQKREAFTIELGWSRKGRFPQLSMRPSGYRPHQAAAEEEYLCRLGELSRGTDWWWTIEDLPLDATEEQMTAYIVAQTKPIAPDEARARIEPLVREALAELARFGLPYLEANAQSRRGST